MIDNITKLIKMFSLIPFDMVSLFEKIFYNFVKEADNQETQTFVA